MITLTSVTKKFGDSIAVDNLSLKLNKGEIYCLIGPNGSGKTTTIKMVTGLYLPTKGQIEVGGFDITKNPAQAKSLFGYIPDEPFIWPKLTGLEFLYFVGSVFGMDKEKMESRINSFLEIFEIGGVLDGRVEDFSRGTKQKLTIIAAFLHNPKILIIDEPIVGLDPQSAKISLTLFEKFAKKGGSILLATHTLSAAERIGHRFGLLKKGKLVEEGTLDQLVKTAGLKAVNLEEIYLKLTQ